MFDAIRNPGCVLAALCVAAVGFAQDPELYFRDAGVTFRKIPPEQRLYWAPHIANSNRRILEAADLAARNEVVIVLGAGAVTEIPLPELARRFDRVILADLDEPSMLEAVELAPPEVRSKIEVRVMDVTSFAASLMEKIADAVEASADAAGAFRRFDDIFGSLAAREPPADLPPADLVVSSLLLSEIPRYPRAYADHLVRMRFKTRLRSWDGYSAASRRLVELSMEDHARLLAKLCRPDGVVYYADTVLRGPESLNLDAGTRARVEREVLPDFRRLKLAETATDVPPAIARLCEASHSVDVETEAFERLLAAYRKQSDSAFEDLVDHGAVRAQWKTRGLARHGAPESWWWLAYPCAIAHSPGAFRVTSWILQPAPAAP